MEFHSQAANVVVGTTGRIEQRIVRGESGALHALHHTTQVVHEREDGFVHLLRLVGREIVAVHQFVAPKCTRAAAGSVAGSNSGLPQCKPAIRSRAVDQRADRKGHHFARRIRAQKRLKRRRVLILRIKPLVEVFFRQNLGHSVVQWTHKVVCFGRHDPARVKFGSIGAVPALPESGRFAHKELD
jgi:hypothetical protein